MKLDISVIILTYNESLHIRRCISNVNTFAKNVFLVDSFSTDDTVAIAEEMGARVFQNKWENNHAKQFNWGLDNLPVDTQWVLRLDADEYLTEELIEELKQRLESLSDTVSGIVTKRRYVFMGKWMKRGTYPVEVMRIFRYGQGVCEQRLMDEHIRLTKGDTIPFENDFVDENLNPLDWWISKHNGYAIREAIELLDLEFGILRENDNEDLSGNIGSQAMAKRRKKNRYANAPLFFRSFVYFLYRYLFKLGFTEGKEGFMWHFFQGWWYRSLVDARIYEIKKNCGNDKNKILEYIHRNYPIALK